MWSAQFIARQREIHEVALLCRPHMREHVRAPQASRQAGKRAKVAVDACRRTRKQRDDVGAASARSVKIERMPKPSDNCNRTRQIDDEDVQQRNAPADHQRRTIRRGDDSGHQIVRGPPRFRRQVQSERS